jgi:hypothetical protein
MAYGCSGEVVDLTASRQVRRLENAVESRLDPLCAPAASGRRWITRSANIRSFTRPEDDLPSTGPDREGATFHKDPEYAAARACKEARPTHRDERKGAAYPHGGSRTFRTVKEHWASVKSELPARFHKILVYGDPSLLAQTQPCALAKLHAQAGYGPGADGVSHEDGGISLQQAAALSGFGKALARDVLYQAGRFRGPRRGRSSRRSRNCGHE